MNFRLSEEQELIRNMVREFVEEEVKPQAADNDRNHRFPTELVARMKELNLLGIPFPEEWGGAGADTLSFAMVVEELSRGCASTGVIVSTHVGLGCQPIYEFGTEAQKEKYLKPLASGEKLGAFCLTEPSAGTDAAAQKTTAVLSGDHYILNGSKIFITNGGQADIYIVMAMTDQSKGTKGISAFIVEKEFPGFQVGQIEDKLGIRASQTAEIIFNNCKVPKENLLGKEGEGFKVAMKALDVGRVGIAAQALGIAQACLDAAVNYAKERQQFGKPIASFQAIQWMIADMATQIQAARHLVYNAAWLKDQGEPFSKEAAMAKLFASETAMQVSIKAIQIHGGYGFTTHYPVERFMRDAKITEIYEGTSEVQRMVIAGQVLR
ncbi:acyl-CoA dehydrogenase [Thermanaerosceptrum fracticalcis]|jgi:butyryl-CoA dehydrogenase|uniref:Acyl-CoA dehydrogenase n=1 Tax=Thermanaerosceptrum fracticalcis TaxID=1712410 RepID=A0A7G6E3T7_THEFR|nr:acyl-CoA dehydrogenase [Thermanaerosceptrum fracticalcis]QNB46741.1 acyl-CoA dehydrogenase [Thermanaerosceptrum fracticalcis]